MPEVTGATRIFAIVADPVEHVKTPEVINALLSKAGYDGILVPIHTAPVDLTATFDAFRGFRNFGGCIVTVPHKGSALSLCDEVSPLARRVGAVNCVRREPDGRLVGTMLDGIGFVDGLRGQGTDPAGRSVYLAGAGGAASAIAFALCEAGVDRLVIANRSAGKRDDLVARLRDHYPASTVSGEGEVAEVDIVVNGTSLGLRPDDPTPINEADLTAGQIVAEVIMEPALTPLLLAAQAKGCRIHRGRHMLEAQAAAMVAHMTSGTGR